MDLFGFFTGKNYRARKARKREAFKKRLENERAEDDEQRRIKKELNDLIKSIATDWNANRFADKIETPSNGQIIYKKENGDVITMKRDILIILTSSITITYQLGILYRAFYIQLFNSIIEIINQGNVYKRPVGKDGKPIDFNHPKKKLYDQLIISIKLRTEHLANLPKDDDTRRSLEMELEAAKRRAEVIKNSMI